MAVLRISKDLALPLDAVTQAIAILARRGAGKTYTGSVLVEEVVRAKVPVVVLDPTGAWWGLRTSAGGDRPGLPVIIFGGDHGDVPLDRADGTAIADVVLDHPGAYVADLSAFTSKAAEQAFAADFLERLYRGKKGETGPLLVVVDEADVFAPQQPRDKGDQLRTLGALEAIVRRGRIRGLGVVLITQRAAVLNKNVLNQTEVLVAMQTTGPQDRAAIDDWIQGNGSREQRDEVLGSLAGLERGEAWIWSPSFLRILRRVRIRTRTTFDSSRTPEAGEATVRPTAFAKVDLEQLGARIAATREQAKANDPAELRRRIAELEKDLKTLQARAPDADVVLEAMAEIERLQSLPPKTIEVPVLNGQVGELRKVLEGLGQVGDRIGEAASTIEEVAGYIQNTARGVLHAIDTVATAPRPAPVIPAVRVETTGREPDQGRTAAPPAQRDGPVSRSALAVIPRAPASAGSLGKAERAILGAIASYPVALTREQLAFAAGYHIRSKGYTNALGALRSAGLVTPGWPAELTPEGRAVAPADAGIGDVVAYWLPKFGRAERAILEELLRIYPAAADREELVRVAGFEHVRTKGFTNALGRLRGLGIVDGLALSSSFAGLVGR